VRAQSQAGKPLLHKAAGPGRQCTFADALHGAHLRAVLHGVQGEVDLGKRLLHLNSLDGLVHVVRIDILWVVLHAGGCLEELLAVACEGGGGGGGSAGGRERARGGGGGG
jgi:hypothetical protein